MTRALPRTRTTTALALVAVSLAGCGGSSAAGTAAAPPAAGASTPGAAPATGTVTAVDQSGDGTTLTVQGVSLAGVAQGWIAVHRDLGGKPGPVVGTVRVQAGSSTDVVVRLDQKVTTGAFWPMLHVDDHAVGTYEFPRVKGADLPVMQDGKPVMKRITLTVR